MSHHNSRLKKNNTIFLHDNIKRRKQSSLFTSSDRNILHHESISLSKAVPQHEDYRRSHGSDDVYGHGKLVLPPIWDSNKNHHHSIISLPSLTPSNQYNHRPSKYDSKRNNQHHSKQHVEDRKSLVPSSSSLLFPLKEEKERKKSKRKINNNNKKRRRTKKLSKLNNCKNEQKESNDCADHDLIRQSQHQDNDSSTTSLRKNVHTVDEYQSSLSSSRRHESHKDTHNDKRTKNIIKKHDKNKIQKSKHDNQKDKDLPITTPKKLKEILHSTKDSNIQKIILHNKITSVAYTTSTYTTAAAILIQKIIRGKISRIYAYKLYRKDLFRQAAESGVLLACEGTEQGKSGWYQQCETSTPLYYKVDRNGTWRLIT